MSAQPQPRLTIEEYLALDRAADYKSEYYNGRMWAMSGGSAAHSLIAVNLGREFSNALRHGNCWVFNSDMRLRIGVDRFCAYPDLMVACEPVQLADDQEDTLLNPILIIEVLSPSTEAHDRGLKFAQYRRISSLQEYALVSQSEPRIEVYRRQASGGWLLSEYTELSAECRFECINLGIPLSEVYLKVPLPAEHSPTSAPESDAAGTAPPVP